MSREKEKFCRKEKKHAETIKGDLSSHSFFFYTFNLWYLHTYHYYNQLNTNKQTKWPHQKDQEEEREEKESPSERDRREQKPRREERESSRKQIRMSSRESQSQPSEDWQEEEESRESMEASMTRHEESWSSSLSRSSETVSHIQSMPRERQLQPWMLSMHWRDRAEHSTVMLKLLSPWNSLGGMNIQDDMKRQKRKIEFVFDHFLIWFYRFWVKTRNHLGNWWNGREKMMENWGKMKNWRFFWLFTSIYKFQFFSLFMSNVKKFWLFSFWEKFTMKKDERIEERNEEKSPFLSSSKMCFSRKFISGFFLIKILQNSGSFPFFFYLQFSRLFPQIFPISFPNKNFTEELKKNENHSEKRKKKNQGWF